MYRLYNNVYCLIYENEKIFSFLVLIFFLFQLVCFDLSYFIVYDFFIDTKLVRELIFNFNNDKFLKENEYHFDH